MQWSNDWDTIAGGESREMGTQSSSASSDDVRSLARSFIMHKHINLHVHNIIITATSKKGITEKESQSVRREEKEAAENAAACTRIVSSIAHDPLASERGLKFKCGKKHVYMMNVMMIMIIYRKTQRSKGLAVEWLAAPAREKDGNGGIGKGRNRIGTNANATIYDSAV
jgi:hypothetical protein